MKYSVIIPVYNKADTIQESVKSVLSQTEKDFELIIVNDGSKDALDDALRVFNGITIINQENGGVSVARNTGIDAAKGDYVCFLDADDIWLPNHLEELSALIDMFPEAKMFSTSHTETTQAGDTYHISHKIPDMPERFLSDNLLRLLNARSYTLIHTNCMCIKRSLLIDNDIYFEPGEKRGEDTDVWYRVALLTPVGMSKAETTIYRRENSTATKSGNSTYTWIFARRYEEIKNGNYSEERKAEYFALIERYKISCALDYLLDKSRKNAKKLLKEIKNHGKRYYLALILANLPYFVSKRILTRK